MIPVNRPVLGKDLDSIRQAFGMLTSDACWLLGLSITQWMQTVRQAPDAPVRDPSLALLVRLLDSHPELQVIPKFPQAQEMFELVNKVQETDAKRFAVMFGSEGSATYRWLRPGSRVASPVARLMHYMKMTMLAASPERRVEMLEAWRDTVIKEGQARGVDDVFKAAAWNPKKPLAPRSRRAARKTERT